jgi:hypothetical protein
MQIVEGAAPIVTVAEESIARMIDVRRQIIDRVFT